MLKSIVLVIVCTPVESSADSFKWMNTVQVTIVYHCICCHIISCKIFFKRERQELVTSILIQLAADLQRWLPDSKHHWCLPSRQQFFNAGFAIQIRKTAGNKQHVI